MPALPEINRPGSIRMRSPSGLRSGTSVSAYFFGVRIFEASGPFPPGFGATIQCIEIANPQAAADAKEFKIVSAREFLNQRQNLFHRRFERSNLGQLRTDVHLQPAQPQILQLSRARIDPFDILERDSKFIFVRPGRDLRVGVRIDIGITRTGTGRDLS
jgi:hypothetical protein